MSERKRKHKVRETESSSPAGNVLSSTVCVNTAPLE